LSIGISREFVGWSVSVGSDAHLEFTSAIAPTLREADLFGEIDQATFGVLLCDANEAAGYRVVQRLAEPLGHVRFSAPLVFVIGAATSPTDGVDIAALTAHAASHPVLTLQAGHLSVDPLFDGHVIAWR
jgi:hypothetical protein